MTDLLFENNELRISDGDFVTVSGIEEVRQHVIAALNTFKGDWVLNSQKGLNYSTGFRDENFLKKDIKDQILGIRHVKSLDNFKMKFDRKTLAINVTAIIKTDYGELYLNESLVTQS